MFSDQLGLMNFILSWLENKRMAHWPLSLRYLDNGEVQKTGKGQIYWLLLKKKNLINYWPTSIILLPFPVNIGTNKHYTDNSHFPFAKKKKRNQAKPIFHGRLTGLVDKEVTTDVKYFYFSRIFTLLHLTV